MICDLAKPIFNSAYDLYGQGKLTLAHFVEVRKAIECVSVRVAAEKASPGDISRLHDLNEAYLKDIEDNLKHREYAEAFHVAVAEVSGNHLSKLLVGALFRLLDALRPNSVQSKKFKHDTYILHKKIIEAMERKDVDLCEHLVAKDMRRTGMLERLRIRYAEAKAGPSG